MIFKTMLTGKNRKEVHVDESLFERIGNDDMEAFGELYEETERVMYAYILTLCKNHEDALDILQDTYLKIKSASHLYQPLGKPLAWMFTIARNLFYEKTRRDAKFMSMDDETLQNIGDLSYVSDVEERVTLETALKVLSDVDREIVVMYVIGGMKHREIANHLNLSLSTELSKYQRALGKMKSAIESRDVVYEH